MLWGIDYISGLRYILVDLLSSHTIVHIVLYEQFYVLWFYLKRLNSLGIKYMSVPIDEVLDNNVIENNVAVVTPIL